MDSGKGWEGDYMKIILILISVTKLLAQEPTSKLTSNVIVYGTIPGCKVEEIPSKKGNLDWYTSCIKKLATMDKNGKVTIEPGVKCEDVITNVIKYYQRDMEAAKKEIEEMKKLPIRLMPKTGMEDKI